MRHPTTWAHLVAFDFHMGNAVRLAADDARVKLAALRGRSGLPEGTNYDVKENFPAGVTACAPETSSASATYVAKLYAARAKTGQSTNVTPFWMVGGAGAEVEVDTETGMLRVLRIVNVADGGRPDQPKIARTQLSGAAIMADRIHADGEHGVRRRTGYECIFADYKIPGFRRRAADGSANFVSAVQETVLSAPGIGESATFGVSPAIANALHDAVAHPLGPSCRSRREAILRDYSRGKGPADWG